MSGLEAAEHRRRIYTETKAKSRCFCLGGKIVCRTGNLMSECAVLCTQLVLFPLLLLEGGGRGMFNVDLYLKFNTHTDLIILFINYLLECCKLFDGKPIDLL